MIFPLRECIYTTRWRYLLTFVQSDPQDIWGLVMLAKDETYRTSSRPMAHFSSLKYVLAGSTSQFSDGTNVRYHVFLPLACALHPTSEQG